VQQRVGVLATQPDRDGTGGAGRVRSGPLDGQRTVDVAPPAGPVGQIRVEPPGPDVLDQPVRPRPEVDAARTDLHRLAGARLMVGGL
jgi:hypothetical protein